jgi:hypothetical protein
MAAENDNRDNISFKTGELIDLGITSTERIINRGENFLNGTNLDEIEPINQENNEGGEEGNDEGGVIVKKPPVKTTTKITPQQKTTQTKEGQEGKTTKTTTPSGEVSDDDILNLLGGKTKDEGEEEPEEEEEVIVVGKDGKQLPAKKEQKLPATTASVDAGEEEDENAIFNSIAAEMVKVGIFIPDEDEEGNEVIPEVTSGEDLLELFQLNARRVASETIENFLNSKGPEAREIFDNVINKGVDPREYLSRYAKVQDFKNLDLTNEDNQEKVVREFYRQAGLAPDSIDKKVKQLKDHSELANEAEEAHKVVLKREQDNIQLLADKKIKDDQDKARVRSEYVNNLARILNEKAKAKEFDGIPLDPKNAQEVFNDLTVERYTLGDQLLTEFDKNILELNRPNNHPLKVKVALLLRMLQTDPKLLSLSKKVISKESSSAFQSLKKRNAKAGGAATGGGEGKGKEKVVADEDKITSWFPKDKEEN